MEERKPGNSYSGGDTQTLTMWSGLCLSWACIVCTVLFMLRQEKEQQTPLITFFTRVFFIFSTFCMFFSLSSLCPCHSDFLSVISNLLLTASFSLSPLFTWSHDLTTSFTLFLFAPEANTDSYVGGLKPRLSDLWAFFFCSFLKSVFV